MNIWVEYFVRVEPIKNNQAQMRENLKWDPPDPKEIQKRFCQTREEAIRFAFFDHKDKLSIPALIEEAIPLSKSLLKTNFIFSFLSISFSIISF